jgi:hypothetical protein
MNELYRSGVMPLVPPVALAGHVFELHRRQWAQCRKCLADVPWWALVERRWVGVGFWPGMVRGECMGAVRALGTSRESGTWEQEMTRWSTLGR